MTTADDLMLRILKCALRREDFKEEVQLSSEELKALFQRAEEHKILPLIFDAAYKNSAFRKANVPLMIQAQKRAVGWVMRQLAQANESLTLIHDLQQLGYDPIVMKGMVCRELYPQPCLRYSVDEDFLVKSEDFAEFHRLILQAGMYADKPEADLEKEFELSFHKKDSPLYIELHKSPFEQESPVFNSWNQFFSQVYERTVTVQIQDVQVRTLAPTDHLLFLILHAFKHFLYSGFGIRQVCDIMLFAEANGNEIDWQYVEQCCTKCRALFFTMAVFRIGENHLGFDVEKACCPAAWRDRQPDEAPLLNDILTGGLHGIAEPNRVHSSNITLSAVEHAEQGHQAAKGLLRSLFPPRIYMKQVFPYVKKHPYLLPWAWMQRIVNYLLRTGKEKNTSALDTLRIGNERLALMKEYGGGE